MLRVAAHLSVRFRTEHVYDDRNWWELRIAVMDDKRTVVSVRELGGVTVVDTGGTLALRFQDAQGGPLHILVPAKLGMQLVAQLASATCDAERARTSAITN